MIYCLKVRKHIDKLFEKEGDIMKKKMNIGGVIEVEYEDTYRPENIKIDGVEYSMERYAASHDGKTWASSARGNILYYESESGQVYGIPQNKFTR